ncbi:hypothetical protein HK096_003675 [Nowakowskiella sp. JEL0078]|nr:hypothetical protein HK096_003675 [Nowakowskiella sp. JEL0078]
MKKINPLNNRTLNAKFVSSTTSVTPCQSARTLNLSMNIPPRSEWLPYHCHPSHPLPNRIFHSFIVLLRPRLRRRTGSKTNSQVPAPIQRPPGPTYTILTPPGSIKENREREERWQREYEARKRSYQNWVSQETISPEECLGFSPSSEYKPNLDIFDLHPLDSEDVANSDDSGFISRWSNNASTEFTYGQNHHTSWASLISESVTLTSDTVGDATHSKALRRSEKVNSHHPMVKALNNGTADDRNNTEILPRSTIWSNQYVGVDNGKWRVFLRDAEGHVLFSRVLESSYI